jgi:hypothetical protein
MQQHLKPKINIYADICKTEDGGKMKNARRRACVADTGQDTSNIRGFPCNVLAVSAVRASARSRSNNIGTITAKNERQVDGPAL